eukprot:126610_1
MTDDDDDDLVVCKMGCIVVFLWAGVASMIYLIWSGDDTMKSAGDYAKYSTEEDCYLIDYESENCKYGTFLFTYTAYAFDKCGNETLTSEHSSKCVNEPYGLHEFKTCYVLHCEEERFTFTKPKDVESKGMVLLILGIVFGICALGLAVFFTVALFKVVNDNNKPSDPKPDTSIYKYANKYAYKY